MDNKAIAAWLVSRSTDVVCPDAGDKFKPYNFVVTSTEHARFATPGKCAKFGAKCSEVAGGFITGSNGELGGKFLYRKVEILSDDKSINFGDRVRFTFLPEETDDGIPVLKINFSMRPTDRFLAACEKAGQKRPETSQGFTFATVKTKEVETVIKNVSFDLEEL